VKTERTIWKFAIEVTDEFTLEMPIGAEPLHVETQRVNGPNAQYEQPCLWALVDPTAEREQRTFYVHGTGHPVHADAEHIGSFLLYGGSFVGHVFEPRVH
jgi:hypothetical protein